MKLLILGSGGCQPPPRPGCMCRVCKEARDKGIPYYRTGPSLYLPEQNILFDIPEDLREQLNREKIGYVKHVFISHWHPDQRKKKNSERPWSNWDYYRVDFSLLCFGG